MVGSAAELTVKAPLELLNDVTSTADFPEFAMEMSFAARVPTVTSPNSTDDGVDTTGLAVDENARALDPQPVSTRLSGIQQTIATIKPALRTSKRCSGSVCSQTAGFCLASKDEELRISVIKRHLSKSFRCSRSADLDRKSPPELLRGISPGCIG